MGGRPGGQPTQSAAATAGTGASRHLFDATVGPAIDGVYGLCLGILRDYDDAWDATNATFEKVLRRLDDYREGNFDAWLKRIAYTTAVDALRARRPTVPLDAADTIEDPAPGPDEQAVRADQRRTIGDELPTLSLDQQMVVQLRLRDLTSEEIAAILGRNRGWVDTTYHRAVKELRHRVQRVEALKGGRP
jgi:RNA polymerase sigma-70 factor (ECF subfamily)